MSILWEGSCLLISVFVCVVRSFVVVSIVIVMEMKNRNSVMVCWIFLCMGGNVI